MDIKDVIAAIRIAPNCEILTPKGIPTVEVDHILPDDLKEFYNICGGIILFKESVFPTYIVQPEQCIVANPVIINSISINDLRSNDPDSITWSWYIVATGPNSQYVTIDLHPKRIGRCYDSRWDNHAEDSSIIALSFTEFLYKSLFYSNLGEYYYWHPPEGIANFTPIGEANSYSSTHDLPM